MSSVLIACIEVIFLPGFVVSGGVLSLILAREAELKLRRSRQTARLRKPGLVINFPGTHGPALSTNSHPVA